MKLSSKLNVIVAGLCISVAPLASGQAFAQTTVTETKYVTVDGEGSATSRGA